MTDVLELEMIQELYLQLDMIERNTACLRAKLSVLESLVLTDEVKREKIEQMQMREKSRRSNKLPEPQL